MHVFIQSGPAMRVGASSPAHHRRTQGHRPGPSDTATAALFRAEARRYVEATSRISTGWQEAAATSTASSTSRTGRPTSVDGINAVAAAAPDHAAYGEALAGDRKPLVAASSIGCGRGLQADRPPKTRACHGDRYRAPYVLETSSTRRHRPRRAGVQSSIVRLPLVAPAPPIVPASSRADRTAKEKGFTGYPGRREPGVAVHVRDVASVFRFALEKVQLANLGRDCGRENPVP